MENQLKSLNIKIDELQNLANTQEELIETQRDDIKHIIILLAIKEQELESLKKS